MHLLMIIPNLALGGAEWAFVRQANALVAAGQQVSCYVPYTCDSAPALLEALDARVSLIRLPWMTPFLHRVLYKLSQWLPGDLEQVLHSRVLRARHRRTPFDVVNPHLHSGSHLACAAFQSAPVPVVETDHGDYALLLQEDPSLRRLQLPLQRLDAVICPARANQERLERLPWSKRMATALIPYAYATPSTSMPRALPTDSAFTFGMVSRGVEAKGWREALAAFAIVRQQTDQPLRLVLVGGGDHLRDLEQQLPLELKADVLFTGAQADPRPWIESFDVALLPSCFTAESLPNVIIECQAQGKPVIATAIGGIPDMLEHEGQPCGVLIPLDPQTQRADIAALATAMQRLMTDATERRTFAERSRLAVQRYQPARCAAAWIDFFLHAMSSFRSAAPAHSHV